MTQTAKRIQQFIVILVFFGMLAGFLLANLLTPDTEISESERRPLAKFPTYSSKNLWSGKYFSEFEDYALDQFVQRDTFRSINAHMKYDMLFQKDNNNIFLRGNNIYKMEYPLREAAVSGNLEIYRKVIDNCFAGTNASLYYCVIPDKNYYLPDTDPHLTPDYDRLFEMVAEALPDATGIDICDILDSEDYYATDLHWNQPEILEVANHILHEVGGSTTVSIDQYEAVSHPGFKGSYFGQAIVKVPTDTITYLTNETLQNLEVLNYETGKTIPVYNEKALEKVDAYDLFLGGPKALLELKNPGAARDKQLVIIRDSFASSLAPLLVGEYSSIIMVDLRYVTSDILPKFAVFEDDADVLFLHNSMILNQKGILR